MQGTITLLNKLKRKDSITGLDIWYKTIIKDCIYKKERVSDVSGNIVSIGQQFTILIPFTGKYIPYKDWKNIEDKKGYYTISNQDIIILDEVQEEVDVKNIIEIKNSYEPNTCEIRSIEQVESKFSSKYEFRVGGV